MKKLLLLLFLIPNLVMAEELMWDLDRLIGNEQTSINLIDHRGTIQQTFTKTHIHRINTIRKKISRTAGIYPKFLISSDTNINAYATWSNGQPTTIYTLGILRKIGEDYDALAAIIGHEYAHLTLSHQESSQTTSFIIDVLATVALVAIDVSFGGSNYNQYRELHKAGLNIASNLTKTKFSRNDELAADEKGLEYSMKSGYSPDGAKRFHLAMNSSSSFMNSHPSSKDRIKRIDVAINSYNQTLNGSSYSKYSSRTQNSPPRKTINKSSAINKRTALIEVEKNKNANEACSKKGYAKDTSQYFACVFKYKRIKKQSAKILEATSSFDFKNNSNLPKKGQVGIVVLTIEKKGIVIFSQSIIDKIPNGSSVTIENDTQRNKATVTGFYDGFYSAKLENVKEIKRGSRVLIYNH